MIQHAPLEPPSPIDAWADGTYVRGLLKVLVAAAALGSLGPVAAVAYGQGIEPATFSALRAALGASLLAILVATGRQASVALGELPRRQQAMLAVAVAANGLMNLALFAAFGAMPVAIVMVVFFTYPVITAVISVALGRERFTPARVLALALVGAGLLLALGARLGGADAALAPVGVALAAAAAVGHAVYLVVVRDGFSNVPPVQATSLVLAGGVVVSGSAALLTGAGLVGDWVASPTAWLAVVLAGTVGAAFPKVWVIAGVRVVGSTRAAVLMLMEPVVAVVAAFALVGQAPQPLEIAGGLAVLLAVLVVQRPDPAADVQRVTGPASALAPGDARAPAADA